MKVIILKVEGSLKTLVKVESDQNKNQNFQKIICQRWKKLWDDNTNILLLADKYCATVVLNKDTI